MIETEGKIKFTPNELFYVLTPAEQSIMRLALETGIDSNIKLAALRNVSKFTVANQTADAFRRVEKVCGRRPYSKSELLIMIFEKKESE